MRQLLQNKKGEGVAIIGTVVGLLVAIIIGVLIWYKINSSITGSSFTNASGLTNFMTMKALWNTTNASANTIWTLFPIVAIVVIAGIILAIVMNFGKGEGV